MPLRIRKASWHQGLLAALILLGLTVSGVRGAIVIQPSNTVVYEGDPAFLYCQFSVPPKSSSTTLCFWARDKTSIMAGETLGLYEWIGEYQKGNCSIKIVSANLTYDDAQWICQLPASMEQTDGEQSRPAKLTVYKTPTPPTIEYDDVNIAINTNLTVSANDSEDFTCESSGGNPAAELTWTLDNLALKSTHEKTEIEDNNKTYKRTNELEINFKTEDDGKILRCSMHHKTMNDTSVFVDIRISVKYETTKVENLAPSAVVVDEGSGYEFLCVADGNPPPKYEWLYKRGDAENWEIKSETINYIIESATYSHEGAYMCMAGNTVGKLLPSSETTFQLRSTTRNIVALVGGIFGAILIVAIIVLAIVVWRLRKKIKEEYAEELPDIETLNRATSDNRPKKRDYDPYMIPMPTERAPLNPPVYSPSPYNPFLPPRPFELRQKTGSWRRDPESHIYAEPHFYETVDGHGNDPSDDHDDDSPMDGPPKLPSEPPSPGTDDGTYLNVTLGDDSNKLESEA